MATDVLRPRDLLVDRLHAPTTSFHRRRFTPTNGTVTNLSVNRRPQRKASPKPDKKKLNAAASEAKRSGRDGGLIMGKVTLLKRGEPLGSLVKDPVRKPAVFGGVSPPQIVMKQIRLAAPPPADMYAGAAILASPSPRSVPLPSFFNKKGSGYGHAAPFDDGATRDLRRMLRLE